MADSATSGRASEGRTGIGSWAPKHDEEGRPDPWRSIFAKNDWPALVISTIEAADGNHTQVQMIPSFTDNRGNGSALKKVMTN